ncbi:hypothetical protein RhiXN_01504 [Rhizoctonia solani]|uniref:Uncharacterized protein n=2 Tax=Rhizoctonia solani TaxID=456999 RepID=A0A8H8T2I3_9AGAM|nr:uncharacterized protein RhiXN_01504 [Rhizoctonia solani]QRW26909.1 hypothetical protein RhiXN_01504 [Rhizoctonia solani]
MATEAPLTMVMPQLHQPRSRPNSLLLVPNQSYAPASPRGGILLNARPMSASFLSPSSAPYSGANTPRSPSPSPAAADSGMDRSTSVYSSLGSRKIRFAPLPEPRREVTVDQDGTEVPCASTYAPDAAAYPVQSPGAGPSVVLDRTDSLVTDSGASTNSTEPETQSQKSAKRSKRNSLLRLVGLGSSSSTLTKRASTVSLPGSASIVGSMFRTTSRESWSGEPSGYSSDNSVARRMSSPLRPTSSRPSSGYNSFGAPLMHSTSDGTGARPTRMLNGRVYGARRARERLQPQPSMEPEFSEWGYGGMGSVSNAGQYSKLQSNTSSLGGRAADDDEDDGSGMGWVRKRKEKKEREEREKKEAEEAAAKAAQAQAEEASNPPRTSTETAGSSTTVHPDRSETPTAPQTPTGTAPPTRANSTVSPRPRTVSSPPSRQNSITTVTSDRHHPTVVSVPVHRGRQESALSSSVVTSPETSPERSSGSSRSSSSSDDEDESSNTGREDDDEEEEENQKRKTALSAGVEKISRHH